MRTILWMLLLLAGTDAWAADRPPLSSRFRGMEMPTAELTWKLPTLRPDSADKHQARTCQVFGRYVVLWSDEDWTGVDALEFRRRPPGMKAEQVCRDGYDGPRILPRNEDATGYAASWWPVGVFDHFVVSVGTDEFGLVGWFALLDLDTGRVAFREAYQPDRGVTFELGKDGPVLTFWSLLKGFDCIPREGVDACWKLIRGLHGMPSSVPQPDCEKAIASQPGMLSGQADRTAQIMVHVRVRGLSMRNVTYLPDRPVCGATP